MAEQASVAMRTADAVILVVDATVGATAADEAAARILLRSGKPVFLAANKVDSERAESDAAELWSLGLGEPLRDQRHARSRRSRAARRGAGRAARGFRSDVDRRRSTPGRAGR